MTDDYTKIEAISEVNKISFKEAAKKYYSDYTNDSDELKLSSRDLDKKGIWLRWGHKGDTIKVQTNYGEMTATWKGDKYWLIIDDFISDHTDDADIFARDKKATKANLAYEIRSALNQMSKNEVGSPAWERAYKLYKELLEYIIGDFTDDGRASRSDKPISAELNARASYMKSHCEQILRYGPTPQSLGDIQHDYPHLVNALRRHFKK